MCVQCSIFVLSFINLYQYKFNGFSLLPQGRFFVKLVYFLLTGPAEFTGQEKERLGKPSRRDGPKAPLLINLNGLDIPDRRQGSLQDQKRQIFAVNNCNIFATLVLHIIVINSFLST